NKYGFIETPYRKVVDGKVTTEVVYLSAMEEAKHTIAQANAEINKDGTFGEEIISARRNGEFLIAPRDQITLMDVSPKQLVSVAASLIPFLENDDANRALMGSNMQRQAVPLIKGEAPLVGTGMERVTARDSGAVVLCKREGIVDQVDSERIIVRVESDHYTSIHIEKYEIEARDTKLGPEEVTRDIPNISESFLRNLDESGVIRIGAVVKPGDILVGKVTPKGETTLTPEEKLLRAIFGEKAGDVRDASLYCPPGIEGTIVDVKIFTRKGGEKDERHKAIEATQVFKLEKNLADEIRILTDERLKRLSDLLGGKILQADLHDEKTNKRLLTKGTELTREIIEKISTRNLKRLKLNEKDPLLIEKIEKVEEMTSRQLDVLRTITEERKEKLQKGDELPAGVIKLVKVYIAMKR